MGNWLSLMVQTIVWPIVDMGSLHSCPACFAKPGLTAERPDALAKKCPPAWTDVGGTLLTSRWHCERGQVNTILTDFIRDWRLRKGTNDLGRVLVPLSPDCMAPV